MDNIYIRYLQQYYHEHGTINDISQSAVVEFEGTKLKIGNFLNNIRSSYIAYINNRQAPGSTSTRSIESYKKLNEMGFVWQPRKLQQEESIHVRYLRQHYIENGTINDITISSTVTFEGQILKIGRYINHIRSQHRNYVLGIDRISAFSEITKKKYQILDEMQIDWNPKDKLRNYSAETDKYLCFLREYYQEHGTINNIPIDMVVERDGETLKIGCFLVSIKSLYHAYTKGIRRSGSFSERSLARYQALIEMGYINTNPTKEEKDINIEYLKKHYTEYGTINDIKVHDIVEFEGQKLQIGRFLVKTRYFYKQYTDGQSDKRAACGLMLKRYQALSELEFNWDLEKERNTHNLTNSAKENGIPQSTLRDYHKKFNGDLEKAIKMILLNKKSSTQVQDYTIENILKEFDIDFDSLISYLNRDILRTGERSSEILKYEGISLREFCLKNNLNYQVIYLAIKLRMESLCDEDLESLINRSIIQYNTKGQQRPATWIYSKYGNELLVKHLLLYIGLDSSQVLRNMSKKGLSLDEALEKECFQKDKKHNYLYGVYHQFVSFYRKINYSTDYTEETASEALINYATNMIEEYHLTKEEFNIINYSFKQYTNAIYQYQLFDVAFEKDANKRVEKIATYNLDGDDIEEAFFLPLKFDQKVLIGRDSELYKRRTLLKNLTVSWNDLTEEERTSKASAYRLTDKELDYITSTRKEIDQAKQKVLKRQ